MYTLLNLPKILSRILPFIYFLTMIYMVLKYENNNELIIYWTIGINKISFINNALKFSILLIIFQLLLTTYIVPKTQESARSFLRNSNLEFFGNAIKPKKFIDTTKNLTIFVEDKNLDGELKNIYLKDDLGEGNFQIITAKKGNYEDFILYLFDGKIFNNKGVKTNNFDFLKTEFNIAKFQTKTTIASKTQENKTIDLIRCILNYELIDADNRKFLFTNCRKNNLDNIYQELQRRILNPIYLLNICLIALFLVLRSKENHSFARYQLIIFILGIALIIFSEITLKSAKSTLALNYPQILSPLLIFISLYFYALKQLSVKKNSKKKS
jgi:lipopolysaccharide export system permease protein